MFTSVAGVDLLLSRLSKVQRTGQGRWSAECPSHPDANPSLSITLKDTHKLLLHCHAGCSPESVLAAVGLTWKDVLPPCEEHDRVVVATYDYLDEQGTLLFQVVRFTPKGFRQRRPDGNGGWIRNMDGVRRVLYRLPELLAADTAATVVLLEGEKDVDRLRSLGYVATCNPGGAGKWRVEYSEALRGRTVIVIADADKPGRAHARGVAESLVVVAASVAVLELPDAKDASAFFDRGGTEEQLDSLLAEAAPWTERENAEPGAVGQAQHRRLTVTAEEFFAERDEVLASIWGDGLLVPGGGYTIGSGEGGVGKTIVLAGLFLSLAAGRKEFLGFSLPGEPIPGLILEAEGSRFKFRERIFSMARSYELDAAKLPLFFHARDAALSIGETLAPMVRECGARAVFLDSVGHFHDGDENSSTEWRRLVTKPLAAISREYRLANTFADHYVKPSKTRQNRYKTRGSAAKVDDCGAAFRLEYGKAGQGSRVLIFDRVRDGALPEPKRIALKMDVAAGHVGLDPEGCADSAPESAADERREKARVSRSLLAQEKIEAALAVLEKKEGFDPNEGVSERDLSAEVHMSRSGEPLRDAIRALEEGQKAIERAPGGGWRRKR